MHVVIFTGGELINSRLVVQAVTSADMVVAADSGAKKALQFGIIPKSVLGDMDSIGQKVKNMLRKKVEFIISPSEKDETDTELAITYAIKKGATEITLLGGIYGDRIDHVLANILYASIAMVPITFINGLQKSFVIKGPNAVRLEGGKNDLLSLIPVQGDVTGLNSEGLKWELQNGKLAFGKPRGVSNVFLQDTISLSFISGILFVTYTTSE